MKPEGTGWIGVRTAVNQWRHPENGGDDGGLRKNPFRLPKEKWREREKEREEREWARERMRRRRGPCFYVVHVSNYTPSLIVKYLKCPWKIFLYFVLILDPCFRFRNGPLFLFIYSFFIFMLFSCLVFRLNNSPQSTCDIFFHYFSRKKNSLLLIWFSWDLRNNWIEFLHFFLINIYRKVYVGTINDIKYFSYFFFYK